MKILIYLALLATAFADDSYIIRVTANTVTIDGKFTFTCMNGATTVQASRTVTLPPQERTAAGFLAAQADAKKQCKEANTSATFTGDMGSGDAPPIHGSAMHDNTVPTASQLAGKADTNHTHTKSQVTDFTHTHAIADTTLLQATLDGKAPLVHSHNANFGCSSTDKVRAFDASGAPICAADQSGAGSTVMLKVAGADYTNSTTTYSDVMVTGSLAAGTYTLNCDLQVSAAATTTGIQISVNGPTQSFITYTSMYFTSATATATWTGSGYDSTSAANGTFPINSSGTVRTGYRLNGQIVTTATGTIAIRARSEVAASAITVYRGSSCTIF